MAEENIKITIEFDIKDKDVRDGDKSSEKIEKDKELQDTVDTVDDFKSGNVGDLQLLASEQMGNLSSFAKNPASFVIGKVFGKFAKGAGIAALVIIFFEVVKTIMLELYKPGRALDIRFREQINKQIIIFLERKEQQELIQQLGKQVITTTMGGLRGTSLIGQVGGNYYNPNRIPANFLDNRRTVIENVIGSRGAHKLNKANRYTKGPGG